MNKRLFESKMKLFGDTNKTLAKYLGLSVASVSAKKNENKAEFTKSEIDKIKQRYALTSEELIAIFLQSKCLKKTQRKGLKHAIPKNRFCLFSKRQENYYNL